MNVIEAFKLAKCRKTALRHEQIERKVARNQTEWIGDAEMREIWKYKLEMTDYQAIKMPVGAELLSVQMQAGVPCLWALVNTKANRESRLIATHGTGHPIQRAGLFIGTYQVRDAGLVFHVFEVPE